MLRVGAGRKPGGLRGRSQHQTSGLNALGDITKSSLSQLRSVCCIEATRQSSILLPSTLLLPTVYEKRSTLKEHTLFSPLFTASCKKTDAQLYL